MKSWENFFIVLALLLFSPIGCKTLAMSCSWASIILWAVGYFWRNIFNNGIASFPHVLLRKMEEIKSCHGLQYKDSWMSPYGDFGGIQCLKSCLVLFNLFIWIFVDDFICNICFLKYGLFCDLKYGLLTVRFVDFVIGPEFVACQIW